MLLKFFFGIKTLTRKAFFLFSSTEVVTNSSFSFEIGDSIQFSSVKLLTTPIQIQKALKRQKGAPCFLRQYSVYTKVGLFEIEVLEIDGGMAIHH